MKVRKLQQEIFSYKNEIMKINVNDQNVLADNQNVPSHVIKIFSNHLLKLEYSPNNQMLADILNKSLREIDHTRLLEYMGLQ